VAGGRLRDTNDLGPDQQVITLAALTFPGQIEPGPVGRLSAGRLTGKAVFVEYADESDAIVAVATEGQDLVVAIVGTRSPGVNIRALDRFDAASRPCNIEFEHAPVSSVALRGTAASAFVAEVRAYALLAASATLLGIMEEVLDMSVQYAKDRYQFGHPIGSFQAIQQRLGDLAVLTVAGRNACAASVEIALEPSANSIVQLAALKGLVSANTRQAVESALQVHGGIGFTDEHRLHLYFKHALRLQASWGSDTDHAVAMGAHLLEPTVSDR
jgi:alkylation response protein AidB-like acyl-CoA dehydrogenase